MKKAIYMRVLFYQGGGTVKGGGVARTNGGGKGSEIVDDGGI